MNVGDFGFAIEGDDHMLQTTCGSPEYIAPEVLQQEGYGTKCDIWSLGVVAYQILFGVSPFKGMLNGEELTLPKLFDGIQNRPVTFPEDSEVSSEARDLICDMLAKDPARRLDAAAVLSHAWVVAATTPSSPGHASYRRTLTDSVRQGLIEMQGKRNWQRARAKSRSVAVLRRQSVGPMTQSSPS